MPRQNKKRVFFTLTPEDEKLVEALVSEGIDPNEVVREALARFEKKRLKVCKKIYSKVGVK